MALEPRNPDGLELDLDLDAGPGVRRSGDLELDLDLAQEREAAPAPVLSASAMPDGAGRAARLEHAERRGRLVRLGRALYRRRRLALATFVIVSSYSAYQAFRVPPGYLASARVMVAPPNSRALSLRDHPTRGNALALEMQRDPGARSTIVVASEFRTREVARRTVERLNLWHTPPFGDPEVDGVPDEGSEAELRAINRVLAGMRVSQVGYSRLIDVGFRAADPSLAMTIANGIAAAYIEVRVESMNAVSRGDGDWLGARLEEVQAQVRSAEEALQRYEGESGIGVIAGSDAGLRRLLDLNAAATDARTRRIQKEALYRQLADNVADPTVLDAFPSVFSDPFIRREHGVLDGLRLQEAELAERLGDRHPDLQRVRAAIEASEATLRKAVADAVNALGSEYRTALAREESLTAALDAEKSAARASRRAALQHGLLKSDVDSARNLLASLTRSAEDMRLAANLSISGVRIIDPAEPPRGPVGPARIRGLLSGAALGLVVALAVVLARESLDNALRTPDDITQALGLPTLGLLPEMTGPANAGYPLLSAGAPPNFDEGVRTLRTELLFSLAGRARATIVVTSAEPGAGKSLIAANMAVALAQAGTRVLLVDADLRRPRVAEIFACGAGPGLSDLLAGQAGRDACLRESAVPGLTLLPSGRTPPDPAGLLGSERCAELLTSLGEEFDWVIVDSPPVMAVTDVSLLSSRAHGVLFVVGAGRTSSRGAALAVDQLRHVRGHVLGAVLNRAPLDRDARLYASYYRKEYVRYYAGAVAGASRE